MKTGAEKCSYSWSVETTNQICSFLTGSCVVYIFQDGGGDVFGALFGQYVIYRALNELEMNAPYLVVFMLPIVIKFTHDRPLCRAELANRLPTAHGGRISLFAGMARRTKASKGCCCRCKARMGVFAWLVYFKFVQTQKQLYLCLLFNWRLVKANYRSSVPARSINSQSS